MSYQALYRVWRPRNFADVVGQAHITRTLQNAIVQEKFSHAYLFSGPRGTGKTSAAKIFAKTINCERSPVKEPCNECAACRGIQDGSISDVIEIDAASNTSVEDIREIRDKVKYASSVVPYKVYIIDEVHMISVNAFNALLKTLEEPPQHVVFILATTEPHKIPLTILSRCQRFDFKPISNQSIVERMQTILDVEGTAVSKEALDTVALAAEGGMRDALSILDQAISYSEESVELEDVLAVTGGVSQQTLTSIVRAMYEKDVQHALMQLNELIQKGKDPARFVYDMIYFLRDVLLYKSAPTLEALLERARADQPFKELAAKVTNSWIQEAMNQLNQCQQEIKWTNSPKVYIEIAILSITNGKDNQAQSAQPADSEMIARLTSQLGQLEKEVNLLKENPVVSAQPAPQRETRKAPSRSSKNSYKIPYERIRDVLKQAEKSALKQVHSQWAAFLSNLKKANAPAHATIQDSKPAAASDKVLVVAFKYEIHCSLFLDNQETIESVLANVMGKSLTIIPIPETDWKELRTEYISNQEKTTTIQEESTADPLVEEARKLFGDDVVEIHD
ncbi:MULTISPECIES: DNA polymerase III subunit gamma/tau [Virgibacillus]|uniref:DNA-directed DNA polymerase n=2 Tax=Virgibacillus TaxID=84406 RepID=A0A024Q5J5_9BACI|nr:MULTISPECIES: DNA polymerase III subunit gamma/tau [Virgibacillus]EQB38683.1 DNA polymerase III subunit gamma/tau [Virgibacillus sp. CM-4]MYL41397.1 DNA polymerase III subunit gamma/tau [Virgibacillus massiliensis]GGJ56824.1 DNA polymerase III subunit gamma/tau [Virgibacillus kapii]CDQ37808.1 DNA polymerase III subunit gamma/tau [Virgibacillus massiliensis]